MLMSDNFFNERGFVTDDEYEEWLESDEYKREELENRIKNRIQGAFVNWSITDYIRERINKEFYAFEEHLRSMLHSELIGEFYEIFQKEHKEAFDTRILSEMDRERIKDTIETYLFHAQYILEPAMGLMSRRIDSLEQDLLDVVKNITIKFDETK